MQLFGIVNITADSFSDGGRFLEPEAAVAQALALSAAGADVIDLGAAASNIAAQGVPPMFEIQRLKPVVARLRRERVPVSIDSFAPETQVWALDQDVDVLNDIHGFPESAIYPRLARARARLVVMHAVQPRGRADVQSIPVEAILPRVFAFFDARVEALLSAGVARSRLLLDPGMGFFLGADPDVSLAVLRAIPTLKQRYGLPVLISVSRKSFLRRLSGASLEEAGAPTLAAELFAAAQGADAIRTHDVRSLSLALKVARAIDSASDRLV